MIARERTTSKGRLKDRKILVVEDETIVAFLLEDMLIGLGCETVWHASSVKEGIALLASHRPDGAVLDVNLGDELVYPLAERLAGLKIPFIFATGYGPGAIQERWRRQPMVQKPYNDRSLAMALSQALEP